MASSMMYSATILGVQSNSMVAPFTGLKLVQNLPGTKKAESDFSNLPSNGGRVQCMKVTSNILL